LLAGFCNYFDLIIVQHVIEFKHWALMMSKTLDWHIKDEAHTESALGKFA
jgi:hypothetical protein